MTIFHAILLDGTGREFSVYTESCNASAAYEELQGDYPEASVVRVGLLSDDAPVDECDHLRALIAEIRGRLLCMAEMLDATRREDGIIDVAPMLRNLADHAVAVMEDGD